MQPRKQKTDKWTALGEYARYARDIEETLIGLLSAIVKTQAAVKEARTVFDNGNPLSFKPGLDAKRIIQGAGEFIGSPEGGGIPRGALYNAHLTVSARGYDIDRLPAYHSIEDPHSQVKALLAELRRVIPEATRIYRELGKMHMKSTRDEIGDALDSMDVQLR